MLCVLVSQCDQRNIDGKTLFFLLIFQRCSLQTSRKGVKVEVGRVCTVGLTATGIIECITRMAVLPTLIDTTLSQTCARGTRIAQVIFQPVIALLQIAICNGYQPDTTQSPTTQG